MPHQQDQAQQQAGFVWSPTYHPPGNGRNLFAALTAAPIVTVFYYPARDLAKGYGGLGDVSMRYFVTSRWRGMVTAPEIPLLVSLSPAATLFTFVTVNRAMDHSSALAIVPALACGLTGGVAKQFVRKYSVNIGRRKNFHGEFLFRNPLHCLRTVTAERGIGYWAQGGFASALLHAAWYGSTMHALQWQLVTREQRSFFEDAFIALRSITFWSIVTAPLRNGVNDITRNVAHSAAAGGSGYIQLLGREFLRGELSIAADSMQRMQRIARSDGFFALFRGTGMVFFKANVPFALTFATYRLLGGGF